MNRAGLCFFVLALVFVSKPAWSFDLAKILRSSTEFPFSISQDLFYLHSEEIYQFEQQSRLGPVILNEADLANLVRLRNESVIGSFRRAIGNSGLNFPSGYLKRTADDVLKSLFESSVAGPSAIKKYDPTGEVGFCFGRATYVHLELIRRGFDANKIGKIFAVGNLSYQKRLWDFHVATFIWDDDSILVIDDTVKTVLTLEQWIQAVQRFDFDPLAPMMLVYLTDPIKFHPALGSYQKSDFERDIYRGYFVDLLQSMRAP